MSIKRFSIILSVFISPVISSAQLKNVEIKDTVQFLTQHLKNTVGKKRYYDNGKLDHVNRYVVTAFSINNCSIDATVKLTQLSLQGKADISYTLIYQIPLDKMEDVVTHDKRDTTAKYDGAPLFFTTKNNKQVIYYKMTEDHTGRVEADGYYSEATLWRNGTERPQIVEVLNALRLRCNKE